MWANEQTDERVAQSLRPRSWLSETTASSVFVCTALFLSESHSLCLEGPFTEPQSVHKRKIESIKIELWFIMNNLFLWPESPTRSIQFYTIYTKYKKYTKYMIDCCSDSAAATNCLIQKKNRDDIKNFFSSHLIVFLRIDLFSWSHRKRYSHSIHGALLENIPFW